MGVIHMSAVYYTLIPAFAVLLSLVLGLLARPKGLMINSIQALAAGTLFAVISTELLPQLDFSHSWLSLSIAIFLGLLLMLALSKLNPNCCNSEVKTAPLAPFITGFSVEFFINGMVIVLSALAGHFTVFITSISLSVCCFVCGLSVTTRFHSVGFSNGKNSISVFLMALTFPIGGLLGVLFLSQLPQIWIKDVIAFGMAILLYILTADLILEGFKPKSQRPKLLFYVGFVAILLIKSNLG